MWEGSGQCHQMGTSCGERERVSIVETHDSVNEFLRDKKRVI